METVLNKSRLIIRPITVTPTMTAIWMGLTTVAESRDTVHLDGHPAVAATMHRWLGLSPFAVQQKLVS